MALTTVDAYGHQSPATSGVLGTPLVAGAVSTTAVGTIAPTTAAGATPTVTAVSANDNAGNFVLNPVTGGGAQAAGAVVVVTFAQPYSAVPRAVQVTMCNNAAGASGIAITVAPQSVTAAGFTINVGAALTTANNYFVTYEVVA